MLYLIDTDWVIHWLHGVQRVINRVEQLRPDGIAISVISIAELYDGVFGGTDPARKEQELLDFLARGIARLDVDSATATLFARERSRLRRAGTPIGDFDLLIGATPSATTLPSSPTTAATSSASTASTSCPSNPILKIHTKIYPIYPASSFTSYDDC